jgi:uncharacterized UPF0160 family protein
MAALIKCINSSSLLFPAELATHDGVFHADETFAVALSALAFQCGWPLTVIRTRQPELLDQAKIAVIDVGGRHETGRQMEASGPFHYMDHNQWRPTDLAGRRGGTADGAPYAAFGLAWAEFGRYAIERITGVTDKAAIQAVWETVDRMVVQPVDEADVGQAPQGINVWSVSRAISAMNPTEDGANFDAAFEQAVELAGTLLKAEIRSAMKAELDRARILELAHEAIVQGETVLVLERGGSWQGPVIAANAGLEAGIDFVVYPDPRGQWMIQCVPPAEGSFDKRVPLPAEWAAKRDQELQALTGVADAIFCHPGRFIAGAATREGVLAMARLIDLF